MESRSKNRMNDGPELSVVMPAYNNGYVVEEAVSRVEAAVKQIGVHYELIVVDDGSVDDTRRKVADYANCNGHIKVVGYERNMGKGYAVKTGFQHATGKAVVFIDSDLDIDPRQILRYFKALRHGDIVIASKWHPQSSVKIPFIRRFLSHTFNVLVRLLTGVGLKDTQTGLKAVRRKALKRVFSSLAVKRYAYDVELLALARLHGLRVVELPVNVRMRGLFKPKNVLGMFVDLLGITYRLRVVKWYSRALKT
jgi:glycosyltransferase involved in cell wall biosynthesis